MAKLLVLATLVASAAAMCPGDTPCSGHGACGTFDRCTCYRNWQGKDCSDRVCPFTTSWNEVASDGVATDHKYTECASKGVCDRKSGECKCFDGFTGVGCRRMSCDDDCSGHGTCETIKTVASAYTGWDQDMITQCSCDPGWSGVNCGNKMCKKGDDPMTLTQYDATSFGASTDFQKDEVQTITTDSCGTGAEFTITYTDWRGEQWTTWAISGETTTAIAIEEALLALPNQAIPSVTVTGTGPFAITFSDALNSGNQHAMTVNTAGCTDAGCQPIYAAGHKSDSTVCVTIASVDGTEEWNVCSDRGSCNTDSGDCECFDGYTGQACEIQTIIT